MIAVLFGLLGAASFGTGDFLGGLASKFLGSMRATWLSAGFGFLILLGLFALIGGNWSAEAAVWGVLSGAAAMIGILFLYASLAIGPMSILSPVGALVGAMVPVSWELIIGEQLSGLAYLGIVIALAAVWFVGFVPNTEAVRPTLRGFIYAVIAGTFIGIFLILIDGAPDGAGLLPLVASRLTMFLLLSVVLLAAVALQRMRASANPADERSDTSDMLTGEGGVLRWRRGLKFAIAAGVIDGIGNGFILYGLILGNLSVVSVLSAMYPGGTILLAALVLRERIVKLQYFGFALAVIAAVLLTLG